ncbi:gas vesicle protein GvpA [Bradyrhizobium oligotrophicum S58]|uniref:Gas vesicle protein GvpA n=1 Tax=Bradyrhizobium oligotrophicum S58 TaxID=1245469 RepID=M4ZMN9_9BRAD|nr:gas vesicle protein [Bradyrhizobium oligotrophicum]BAM87500.1 gas vesicle protein GvpA [Bradyrhizobium oligotrophicum S58]
MTFTVHQPTGGDRLADILERVLDKGIVVAGDVTISLVGIELLNIKIRLIVATVDRALELGINWWEADPRLTTRASELSVENEELKKRLALLEADAGRNQRPRKRRVRSIAATSGASHER